MFTQSKGMALLGMVFLLGILPTQSRACNRTYLQLDSLVFNAPNYDLYLTLCIGGGITGTQKGADNHTRTFAFNFYGSPTLSDEGFFPATVPGQQTGVTVTGTYVGSFMGSSYTIGYIDPGLAVPFICVSSTATCGNEHTQCNQYRFTMNEVIDSVRVVGAEGSGNPVAGCYPDQDMLVAIQILDVEWSYFNAGQVDRDMVLNWGIQEFDEGRYQIRRGTSAQDMAVVGTMTAEDQQLEYSWTDRNVEPGVYLYQLEHLSGNGELSLTEVVSVLVLGDGSGLSISPSVVSDVTTLRFNAGGSGLRLLSLFDQSGRELIRKEFHASAGLNEVPMDLSALPAGVYLVELRGGSSREFKRILRR